MLFTRNDCTFLFQLQTMPPAGGLPVARDPFGNDPFATQFQQPGMRPAGFPATAMSAPAGYPPANPFGGPAGMGHTYNWDGPEHGATCTHTAGRGKHLALRRVW